MSSLAEVMRSRLDGDWELLATSADQRESVQRTTSLLSVEPPSINLESDEFLSRFLRARYGLMASGTMFLTDLALPLTSPSRTVTWMGGVNAKR
ncbi:MAG: hypothetical protein JWN44_866 [Myxococcales bacterium]|nr:hypothetical protein [Myxococcales bacterium]